MRGEIISVCQHSDQPVASVGGKDGGLKKELKMIFIETWNFYTGLFPLNNLTMHYMEDEESNK